MANPINVTTQDFEDQVINAEGPVAVDFWADWCPPCKALNPEIKRLAEDLQGEAGVVKVNVDEEPELAQRYRIQSIPTILIFQDGEVVERRVGFQTAAQLAETIRGVAV